MGLSGALTGRLLRRQDALLAAAIFAPGGSEFHAPRWGRHAGIPKAVHGGAWLERHERAVLRLAEHCEVGDAPRQAIAAVSAAVLAVVAAGASSG